MKKLHLLVILLMAFVSVQAQSSDSLVIYYYDNYPYAYTENGKLQGIEIDIINEYVSWMKQKKEITLLVSYRSFSEFGLFYDAVKNGRNNVIGLGSVTNNSEREKEVKFSPPYMRNVAVLITNGMAPTVKSKAPADVTAAFGDLHGFVVGNSIHAGYMDNLKKTLLPNLRSNYANSQRQVLENISTSPKEFGYVDIVAYWAYLKNNPSRYLKIQKVFNESNQVFSFIMPKVSNNSQAISEFFESGFGFTSTKKYSQILEKYLGHEIIESVELK